MVTCKVCHAWRPSNWNGWKWIDTEAPCIYVSDHNMFADGTCSKASITVPSVTKTKIGAPISDALKRSLSAKQPAADKPVRNKPINNTAFSDDLSSDFHSDDPTVQHLYAHQQEAYERFKDSSEIALFFEMGVGKSATILAIAAYKFRQKQIDSLLVVAPNDVHCITGDSVVTYGRDTCSTKSTISALYKKFHGVWRYDDYNKPFYIKALGNGYIEKAKILAIEKMGVRKCITIQLQSGKQLTCTPDHKILTPEGYIEAGYLKEGGLVLCNGEIEACPGCGSTDVIREHHDAQHGYRENKWAGWCKSCAYSRAHSDINELIAECICCGSEAALVQNEESKYYLHCKACINRLTHDRVNYEKIDAAGYIVVGGPQVWGEHSAHSGVMRKHRWMMENHLGRKLETNEHVHHKDGNKLNNTLENLEIVSPGFHIGLHNAMGAYRGIHGARVRPKEDYIVSIIEVDEQETYDIEVETFHNFVANGFIVHNCQWYKEQLPLWLTVPYDSQCYAGRGGSKECYPFDDDEEMLKVVCVNIDTFSTPTKWKDVVEWANANKTMIILDESTTVKNISSQRTQRMLYEFNDTVRKGKTVVKTISKSVARAILTGTPVTNGPMDLWSMMEFLRPNFFGRNYYSFQAHFGMFTSLDVGGRVIKVPLNEEHWESIKACKEYSEAAALFGCSEDTYNTIHSQEQYEGPYKHADELKTAIQPVSMFKQLKDCMAMPKQNYSFRLITMNDEQRKCYDDMVKEFVTTYEDHTMTALNKMTAIIRLQQISSGFLCDKEYTVVPESDDDTESAVDRMFGLTDDTDVMPNEIQWIGKSNPKLDALYRDVDESAKPVIIITRFSAEAARIFSDLSQKYKCCLFTGWKRVGTIEEFKAGSYPVMVANSAVVARGFNLQNSHNILFYSNTFSLELRLQAEGRIFRIGQTQPCNYVDYIYDDSVDEKIVHALHMKRSLLDFIRTADLKELVK